MWNNWQNDVETSGTTGGPKHCTQKPSSERSTDGPMGWVDLPIPGLPRWHPQISLEEFHAGGSWWCAHRLFCRMWMFGCRWAQMLAVSGRELATQQGHAGPRRGYGVRFQPFISSREVDFGRWHSCGGVRRVAQSVARRSRSGAIERRSGQKSFGIEFDWYILAFWAQKSDSRSIPQVPLQS